MCKVKDCIESKVIAKGYCQFHYDRLRRYGDLKTRPKKLNCQDCKIAFDVRRTGTLPIVCDSCKVERHRIQQRKDRRRKGLWELYRLTLEEYQNMHNEAGGLCEICRKKQSGRGKAKNQLSVDHNHNTGKIRGLLCTNCNTALGGFKDDVELLKIAIKYLEERNG